MMNLMMMKDASLDVNQDLEMIMNASYSQMGQPSVLIDVGI